MVALEFLVLSVIVRIGVEQQAIQVQALESLHFFYSPASFFLTCACVISEIFILLQISSNGRAASPHFGGV
jgi:hypothetical protein